MEFAEPAPTDSATPLPLQDSSSEQNVIHSSRAYRSKLESLLLAAASSDALRFSCASGFVMLTQSYTRHLPNWR